MKDLVCCAGTFFCSPFQPNNSPGCSYTAACPTLGAGDPDSRFHARMYGKDLTYPQVDQQVRMSTSQPDWPLATNGKNYASLYKVGRRFRSVWGVGLGEVSVDQSID